MKENTIKGTLTELQCQKDFITRGFLVSQPIVADSKYDYIVDINGQLYRIQCKSATLSEDKTFINLKTKTTNVRTMKDTFYSSEDIEAATKKLESSYDDSMDEEDRIISLIEYIDSTLFRQMLYVETSLAHKKEQTKI